MLPLNESDPDPKPTPFDFEVPCTWDDIGQLGSALSMLTQANLSEDRTAKMCAPILAQLADLGAQLLAEDSDR